MKLNLNKTQLTIAAAALLAVVGGVFFLHQREAQKVSAASAASAADQAPITKSIVAGPGLVEPDSENVQVGSELAGKLKQVLAEEGDVVKKGQILAILVNDDYKAQVESSQAQVHQAEANYERILNGSRDQERAESAAAMHQAEAVEASARADWERSQKLFDDGIISREVLDHYRRDFNVAEEQFEASKQHFHLIDDRQRNEDIASLKAQLENAHAQLDNSQAVYAKTFLRAPFDGTILRKHHRTGESITNSSVTPDPVFTMGDVGDLRVRVDVDETDVSRSLMVSGSTAPQTPTATRSSGATSSASLASSATRMSAPTSPTRKPTPRFSKPSSSSIPAFISPLASASTPTFKPNSRGVASAPRPGRTRQ